MKSKVDYVKKRYGPMMEKNLRNALANRLSKEFPRIGGPRILSLCAEMILETLQEHLVFKDHVQHGQVLWMAYDINDPPTYLKTTAKTRMVPVVLDISTPEDIESIIDRKRQARVKNKIIRLCYQSYEQGGLLSNCDLAELLNLNDSTIASILTEYERENGKLVPRRATVHDMGTGLTHKRIICRKRHIEGKPSHIIAKETYHSIQAVDRYLGQFDRVRHCRKEGMSPEKTAFTLRCSIALVNEYITIDKEIGE